MRTIGLVSNTSWSIYNFRLGLIRALINRGYRVVVIAPEDHYTKLLEKEVTIFENLKLDSYGTNPIDDFQSFLCLYKIYKRQKIDFLFHYTVKPNIYGSLAAALLKIPSIPIITGLGQAFTTRSLKTKIIKWLYKASFLSTKEVWFLNESDATILTERKIIPESKVKFLPSEGVNTNYFSPVSKDSLYPEKFKFLFAGRLIKEKGVYDFIEAARILNQEFVDVEFHLLGFIDPKNPSAIHKEEVKVWEREGIIHYLGESEDVRLFIDQTDCIVLPSYYREGIPRILLEGASMGVPLISTDNVGCRKVVLEGVNGFLCPKNDALKLAKTMKKMMLLSPEKRASFGEKGRELVSTFFDERLVLNQYFQTLGIQALNTKKVKRKEQYA